MAGGDNRHALANQDCIRTLVYQYFGIIMTNICVYAVIVAC